MSEKCKWKEEDVGDDLYNTDCCESFYTTSDFSPLQTWMRYCCFCGKPVEIEDATERLGQDEEEG